VVGGCDLANFTDLAPELVLAPTAWKYNSATNNRTGTYSPDFPDAANVLTTDTVDGAPGTFDEASRNTNPGAGNVAGGVQYKILNTSYSGTLTSAPIYLGQPAAVDVTRGIADCTPYRLAAGDDALILARLHRAGLQFDIPLASTVTAQITMPRNAGDLTAAVAQSAGTIGADWPRSVVAVGIQDAVTAAITYRGPAEMRIRIDTAGQITTGVMPVTIT
jgi:hypothetical protein